MEKFYLNQIFLAKEFGDLLSQILTLNEEFSFIIIYDNTLLEFKKYKYNYKSFPLNNLIFIQLFNLLRMYIVEENNTEDIFSIAKKIFSLTEIILKEKPNTIELDKSYLSDLKLFNIDVLSTHAIEKYLPLNLKINSIYNDNKIEKLNFKLDDDNKESVVLNYFHNIRAFISKNITQLFIYIQEIVISGPLLIYETNEKYLARANHKRIPLLKDILNFKKFSDLPYDNLNLSSFKSKTMFESDIQIRNFIDYIDLINYNFKEFKKIIHLTILEEKFILIFIIAFNSNEKFHLPDTKDLNKLLDDCFGMISAEENFLQHFSSWGIYKLRSIIGCYFFSESTILKEVEKRIIVIIDESTLFMLHSNKLNNYKILEKKNKALALKKPVLELIKKDLLKFTNIQKFILDLSWLEQSKDCLFSVLRRIESDIEELKIKEKDFLT